MALATLALHGGNPLRTKPFPTWPVFDENEEAALLRVLQSGKWWAGAFDATLLPVNAPLAEPASEVMQLQRDFALAHDSRYGLAVTNGTSALAIILRALGIGPGDEVIVPPYTYIASASTIMEVGATPIFADIDPQTYNLDPRRAEEAITPRTRAIVVVHFAGQSADMDAFTELAERRGVTVIEDAAHAHGASWRERKCGSLASAGGFSFQASKNMTAGEGGMITTNNAELAAVCHSIQWNGRAPGRPWYEHHHLGGTFRMTEFQAAILRVQLTRLPEQTARRDANGRWLADRLREIPGITPVRLDARATTVAFHLFCLHYDPAAFGGLSHADFAAALQAEGIPCSTGYKHPLYKNPLFLEWTFPFGNDEHIAYADFAARCPACEQVCTDTLWLPQSVLLGEVGDLQDIIDAIVKIQEQA